jgi:hypothetical protein
MGSYVWQTSYDNVSKQNNAQSFLLALWLGESHCRDDKARNDGTHSRLGNHVVITSTATKVLAGKNKNKRYTWPPFFFKEIFRFKFYVNSVTWPHVSWVFLENVIVLERIKKQVLNLWNSKFNHGVHSHGRSRKLRLTTVGDPPRWPCDTPLSAKVGTKFRQQVAVAQSV